MANPTPCLDFFSADFDALTALRTEGLQPPNPRVRPLDNLNKCRRILPADVPESLANAPIREPRSQESIAAQQRAKARTSLILEKAAERARQAKILDTIADKLREGPLGLLVRCYEERLRIQVWTRHTHGIRGTMVGFVRALDKHFNMVMHDVDEQYSVRRRVLRLVNKRGRVPVPQLEKETADKLLEDETGDWDGNQKKEQNSVGVENLTERMKELKLFPKLEYRRRHLKQCAGFCTWGQRSHGSKAGVTCLCCSRRSTRAAFQLSSLTPKKFVSFIVLENFTSCGTKCDSSNSVRTLQRFL